MAGTPWRPTSRRGTEAARGCRADETAPWLREGAAPLPAGRPGLRFEQSYTARSPYYTDHRVGAHRLVVAVECQLDGYQFHALLDTAADWCVLSLEVAELL